MLSERSELHLLEMSRTGKSIETENRLVAEERWVEREKGE